MKKLIILALVAIAVITAAYFSAKHTATTPASQNMGAKLLPELENNIANVGTIIIRSKGMPFKVHYENGAWVMPNKYNYKVDAQKIRKLVQNSADISIIEPKSDAPENLPGLGLDDPEKETSEATRLVFLSIDEKTTYADFIKGLQRKGVTANRNEFYARKFNENQSYLVSGDLNIDLSAHTLLNGDIFSIPVDKIKLVKFDYPGDSEDYAIGKSIPGQLDFEVLEPEGSGIKPSGNINSIAGAMESLRLEDIIMRSEMPASDPIKTVIVESFDGIRIEINFYNYNNDLWTSLDSTPIIEDNSASELASKINNLAGNWLYKVNKGSVRLMGYKLQELGE